MRAAFIVSALVVFGLLTYGLHAALVDAPTEATMGDVQRIFYYHVPSAWTAFLCFIANFFASIVYLINRNPKLDAFAVSAAEVGVIFCTVVLLTGPIWARPVWGIWWTWDARLTSTLVLWLIYVSYLVLRRYSTGSQTAALSASLAVFGFVDVIFVYMAIRWFRTQHPQPVVGGAQGSGIDPAMMHALLMNFLAFAAYGALLLWLRYRLERTQAMVEEAHATRAVAGGTP